MDLNADACLQSKSGEIKPKHEQVWIWEIEWLFRLPCLHNARENKLLRKRAITDRLVSNFYCM